MTLSLSLPLQPELTTRYGLEEAVMLAVVMELVGGWQGQVTVSEQRVFSRVGGISRQQQGAILAQLASQGLLSMTPVADKLLTIDLNLAAAMEHEVMPKASVDTVAQPMSGVATTAASLQQPEIPPSITTQRGRDDELSRIFAAKEAQQAMLTSMHAEWQPSTNILRMLTHNMQVSEEFAMGLRDEFVVYYMDKDRRESPGGWDQKFLKWVKKEHIQQQTAAARAQQQGQTRNYAQNEEARYHAREQRQQLTDAVLDLGNTDW